MTGSPSWLRSTASVLEGGQGLWPDPWFIATLMDAYFGFLTFFLWVAYKETSWIARGSWFIAIMLLGNFAMCGYLLWQLSTIKDFSWEALLLRRRDVPATAASFQGNVSKCH